MLVREGREGDGGETPRLQPVNCRRVDGNGFLRGGVGTVLKVPGVINVTHTIRYLSISESLLKHICTKKGSSKNGFAYLKSA